MEASSNVTNSGYRPSADFLSKIQDKERWLKMLKQMGEEPYEIEYDVDDYGRFLAAEFGVWLSARYPKLRSDFIANIPLFLIRFLCFQPSRRFFSPLTCGKTLQQKFCVEIEEELAVEGLNFGARQGLKFFLQFREEVRRQIQ